MAAATRPKGRIYTFKTLRDKGIPYHPNHIRKMVNEGSFPAPIYLSERVPAWTDEMLDKWIAECAAA